METLEGVTVTLVSINKRTLSKSIAVTHTFNFDGVSEEKRRIEQFSDNEITLFGRPCQGITKSCGSMDVSKWQDDSSGADESIGIYFFFPRNQMLARRECKTEYPPSRLQSIGGRIVHSS